MIITDFTFTIQYLLARASHFGTRFGRFCFWDSICPSICQSHFMVISFWISSISDTRRYLSLCSYDFWHLSRYWPYIVVCFVIYLVTLTSLLTIFQNWFIQIVSWRPTNSLVIMVICNDIYTWYIFTAIHIELQGSIQAPPRCVNDNRLACQSPDQGIHLPSKSEGYSINCILISLGYI